ncbi:MAG: SDR family NAD(P)-dependent oxidoreductase [Alphaproteobacteria bacterium]|nr:SDR family NAD(P)-dependent oxidoreductase [Alphaproteobacteria bacterium]
MSHRGSKWIQASARRGQARAHLVCLPHGGGSAQAYRDWGRVLPDRVEVIAIAPPGRGARFREPAITQMAAMRAAIADALAPIIDKPYAIFGHSVGALTAFELALELQARRAPPPMRVFLSSYASPQVAAIAETFHDRSEADLLQFLDGLGHDALFDAPASDMDAELRQHMLKAVRADFKLAETHRVTNGARLQSPMTILGGACDPTLPPSALDGWSQHAADSFEKHIFPGGHFYTETARDELLDLIASSMDRDLNARPKSIVHGKREAFPTDKCLHRHFRDQVTKTPHDTALVGAGGAMTFAQLDQQSDLLARRLIALGCKPDRLVAILMATSAEFVIAYLAALKAGGAYLPIPVATPDAAIGDILAAADPVAVVTCQQNVSRLPQKWQAANRSIVMHADWAAELASASLGDLETADQPTADNLAYCVMTSGTTGKPKGIVCPHRGAVNSYWWRYRHLPYHGSEREACNVFFVWEVLRPLLQGQPAYIIPDDTIFDPRRLIEYLGSNAITRVLFTPSLLDQILSAGGAALAKQLPDLRTVILNGEVVTTSLARRFANALPGVALINDYSISECHDVATLDATNAAADAHGRYLPVGAPMSNVSIYVLGRSREPVPQGEAGEVWVGGDSLARGYLNQPDLTATRFRPDPFAVTPSLGTPAPRMYQTGDVGRLRADGQLEISGRSDFMVKLRGYTVVLSAIEAEICSHPQCSAAVVIAIDDPETGQPDHLVAYVAGQSGKPTADAVSNLRAHLKQRLPQYAIPSFIVPLAALPIDGKTGKVDRNALPESAGRPAVTDVGQTPCSGTLPASSDVAVRIMATWQRLLGAPPIEPSDNFFDLGGHSLLAAEMTRAVEADFGVSLSVIDVFEHATLEGYATHVARCRQQQQDTAMPSAKVGVSVSHESNTAVAAARPARNKGASTDIAVIGMSGRFPGAKSLGELWKLVLDGRSSVRRFTDEELRERGVPDALLSDPDYVKAGAILDDVAGFDPRFWGLSHAEAILMDPQQRLFLECCWHALENAGHKPGDANGNIGVFAGCYLPSYLVHHLGADEYLDAADPTRFHLAELGNDKDYLASRTAYLMNLTGPAISVQTSCSTGLVAIAQAASALRDGQCDMALAGASSITFPQGGFISVDGHIGTQTGICRAFDAKADGTILGDGVGVVALRRLDEAMADGNDVLAVIKGYGINNDGAAKAGYSAPSATGQSAVISRALDMAGISSSEIGYVETHGTGTHLGDPIEVRGLTEAFRRHRGQTDASDQTNPSTQVEKTGTCALGSIKPNIGHSNIAAGVAGFIKAVLAVREGVIPPMANFERENPELDLARSPFRIPRACESWPAAASSPRRAGISSFGIGGTNCHVVIEEPPVRANQPAEKPTDNVAPQPVVLPLSAKSPEALRDMASTLAKQLRKNPHPPLGDVAATLQSGRSQLPYRLAVPASTGQDASLALLCQASNLPTEPAEALSQGRIVFVIPGHGSQYKDMGAGLYAACPAFRKHYDDCLEAFRRAGYVAAPPTLGAPSSTDPVTAIALQSGIFSVGYALGRTLMDWGVRPAAICGHSLGEYAAATLAGVLQLEDAARLVTARAQGTELSAPGAMLAVMGGGGIVADLLAAIPGLSLAAHNSPTDTVVSGGPAAIERAENWCREHDAPHRRLPVTTAFHSPLMEKAAETLRDATSRLAMQAPQIPLISNLTGEFWTEDQWDDPQYWVKQMLSPVRFSAGIANLLAKAPAVLLETGPGNSLQSAIVRSAITAANGARPAAILTALGSARKMAEAEPQALAQTIADLWQAGISLDWEKHRPNAQFKRVALPGYPFQRIKCWPAEDRAQANHAQANDVEANHVQANLDKSGHAAAVAEKSQTRQPWEDIFYLPSWSPLSPKSPSPNWIGEYILLSPEDGLAADLAETLADKLTTPATKVTMLRAGQSNRSYRRAIAAANDRIARNDGPARILDLSFLDVPPSSTHDIAGHAARLAEGLANLASETRGKPLEMWLLTSGALKVASETSLPRQAALVGPIITASQEHPDMLARLIDVSLTTDARSGELSTVADHIASQVCAQTPSREPLLAIRGRHLWGERFEPLPMSRRDQENGITRLKAAGGPHIITGGSGRIGKALARRLTGLGCRVIMVSRKPDKSSADLLGEFGEAAALIEVQCCDVAIESDVRQLLVSTATAHGGIGGIFHAAGLADLRYLEQTTHASIAAECAPKIAGLENLRTGIEVLQAQSGVRPEFVMLFSSLAAILGGLGMAGYMTANRYLDASVAQQPVTAGVPLISVNFDDWDFDYTKEQVAAYAHTRQGLALSSDEGLAAIDAILGRPNLEQVVLSLTPLESRVENWLRLKAPVCAAQSSLTTPAHPLTPKANGETITSEPSDTTGIVLKAYAKVIGSQGLAPHANFFELGGDSLLAAQLAMELRKVLPAGVKLSIADIFEHPSPQTLSDSIDLRSQVRKPESDVSANASTT